jgi:hypothetical protein
VKPFPRWPLVIMALPAAVAVWSGWVQLGMMCGFGVVQPLPGIVPWHINTAVTLPVGTEAYAAFALGAWLHSATAERAKKFARNSAIGSLALGVSAQVSYHLLAASGATRAPWPVTVLVSSVPVVVLGFGAALSHLLRQDVKVSENVTADAPVASETEVTAVIEATPESVSSPDTTPAIPATEIVAALDMTPDTDATPEATVLPLRTGQPTPVKASDIVSGLSDIERRARRLLKTTPDMSGAELARRLDLPNAKAGQRLKARVATA